LANLPHQLKEIPTAKFLRPILPNDPITLTLTPAPPPDPPTPSTVTLQVANETCSPFDGAGRTYMQYVKPRVVPRRSRKVPDAGDGARLRQHAGRESVRPRYGTGSRGRLTGLRVTY